MQKADAGEISTGEKIDLRLRWFGNFYLRPFYWVFGKLGISPNWITLFGLMLALLCGYLLAVGKIPWAAAAYSLSGIFDLLDGYVAKMFDKVTPLGSFLDSIVDRVSDAAVYFGLALYFMSQGEGVYAGLSISIMICSFLISYVRAKAETLDVRCRAGLMSRAPRYIALVIALFMNGLSPWVLKIGIWIIAVLILETLVERIVEAWKGLDQ